MPAMNLALRLAVLLCAVCAVLCYRSPQSGPSGSYSLTSFGKYPAPTVFNPKNQGLPDAYKLSRMLRSVDDQVARGAEQLAEEPDLEELLRQRQRRSPTFVQPTPAPAPPRKWLF